MTAGDPKSYEIYRCRVFSVTIWNYYHYLWHNVVLFECMNIGNEECEKFSMIGPHVFSYELKSRKKKSSRYK